MEFLYDGLTLTVHEDVYRPAEDSLMLADAVKGLRGSVLDVGCGSGLASLSAARSAESVLGVDINPEAVACAVDNAKKNGLGNATFIQSDLFSNVEGQYDAILFNPPYLPTSDDEHVAGLLDKAFDGGKDGRTVLERFLDDFANHLKPEGVLYLVQSSLNDLEKTEKKLNDSGFRTEVINQQDFFFEKLFLLKAEHQR
jgi:release factor glutamine methyltransferase